MAAESPRLEAKARVEYLEIAARSFVSKVPSERVPFRYGINPYRGCEFGCRYCYARYAHEFMELRESEDFENRIYAKSEVAEILRREIRHSAPTGGIAIGTATDPYQPAERRFQRTRAVLEVFAEQRGLAIHMITKSDLVQRDIPLFLKIAENNHFTVTVTITTLDTALARALEPRAPRPDLRLKALRAMANAGVAVGV